MMAIPEPTSNAGPLASDEFCKPEEKDWRDHSWDARRSITNAERCDRHAHRRVNLLAAMRQLEVALSLLPEVKE